MTRVNKAKTSERNLAGLALWELRRADPIAYRAAVIARITELCLTTYDAQLLDCGRCFTYRHFAALLVTAHVADCVEHGDGTA